MKKEDINTLIKLRKELHQHPDLSNDEAATAHRIKDFFEPLKPDKVIDKIGGNGLAFIYEGNAKGPTTMIRCELDGLPIPEETTAKHKSTEEGKSHSCGHDGHMTIVAGVGMNLAENPISKGRVILLYQPAEETGEGAEKVIKDKQFPKIKPDIAFALHNLPGQPKNEIILKKGSFAAASKGMVIKLKGKTSHAAHPEDGNSPATAMAKIIVGLQALPESMNGFSLITIINAVLGEVAFGTSPGEATIRATLRTYDDDTMDRLTNYAEELSTVLAKAQHLGIDISYTESFASTINDEAAWEQVNEAAKKLKLKTKHIRNPFRWSEDFGHFSIDTPTMFFGLGSGKTQPQLHNSNFDFPDTIIPTGVGIFSQIINQINR
ncbi:amidohydrolase [Echinicola strongylocentroti]|uniref:Amidohydrolase n=1 Tax=Echinicola strongylocentroti TaxID=1795355 RepID=A0A2Z4IIX5_9BACT|nr:amidohydrolase [Echinicola strongylocentroti]AWW31092.1 amidohydrolase [Echinicola strongylocentroti]